MGMAQPDKGPFGVEKRVDKDRRQMEVRARIKQVDTQFFYATLLDLSTSGFKMASHVQINESQRLMIKLDGLEMLQAKVVWRDRDHYGCIFTRPLHPAVLDNIEHRFG